MATGSWLAVLRTAGLVLGGTLFLPAVGGAQVFDPLLDEDLPMEVRTPLRAAPPVPDHLGIEPGSLDVAMPERPVDTELPPAPPATALPSPEIFVPDIPPSPTTQPFTGGTASPPGAVPGSVPTPIVPENAPGPTPRIGPPVAGAQPGALPVETLAVPPSLPTPPNPPPPPVPGTPFSPPVPSPPPGSPSSPADQLAPLPWR